MSGAGGGRGLPSAAMQAAPGFSRPLRVAIAVVIAVAFAIPLALSALGEVVVLVVYRGRPMLLHYGHAEVLGHCRVKETDDPTSDVLANLVDADGDGRSDYRLTASIDGSRVTCERRGLLVWRAAPTSECDGAARACRREPDL